jgi:hypothetical protein
MARAADSECVLCDWTIDLLATVRCAYRPGQMLPLTWRDGEITEVLLTDGVAESMYGIALVEHWAVSHPEQLRMMVGEFELDTGGPRWWLAPVRDMPPT